MLSCFQLICESIFLTYIKYMMDKLYYSPYHIGFAIGINLFIMSILVILSRNFDNTKAFFKNTGIGFIILEFLLYSIVMFSFHLLNIFTISYFTPNHNLITYVLAKMIILLIIAPNKYENNNNKFYSIIFFAFTNIQFNDLS